MKFCTHREETVELHFLQMYHLENNILFSIPINFDILYTSYKIYK